MPPRNSPDAIVGAVIGDLLNNGKASLLYQQMVKEDKDAVSVSGGVNWPLGTPFEYNGPTLLTIFAVSPLGTKEDAVVASVEKAIARLADAGPSPAELSRVVTKMRSDMIDNLEAPIDRASALAHATLFDGNPDRVNRLPSELATVTPEQVKQFAKQYLVASNRTIIERDPAAESKSDETKNPEGE